jgi:hypothetical protein
LTELGAGNGRDLSLLQKYFNATGIDQSFENEFIQKIRIEDYIKNNTCSDIIYTRFLWHAIEEDLQEMIINWCKGILVIEARTDKDRPKIYMGHKRNLVNVEKLKKQLINFTILYCEENVGWARYKDENPHIIRMIAKYGL